MAITVSELAAAVRLSDGTAEPVDPELGILRRLMGVAQALIEKDAPAAPDSIKDECVVRMVGYLLDAPTSPSGQAFSNAWVNSGAASLASRWVERRAGIRAPDTATDDADES
ncbi:MAG: hypothetical protein OXM01_03330 [Gemmatimonadota bacterium]|nr:hypothetical protein [Gemmatimonadota bacterium]